MDDTIRRAFAISVCILVCGFIVMGCGNSKLTNCPDCGAKVSKRAVTCPQCGLAAPGLKAQKLEQAENNEQGKNSISIDETKPKEKLQMLEQKGEERLTR